MQAETFKRLQSLFDAALEQEAAARTDFVNLACGDDRAMAEEVLMLLAYEAKAQASETVRPFALAAAAFDAVEANALIGQTIGRFRVQGAACRR
jgi:hypothetical protein